MKTSLLAHLSGQPHLHRTEVALIITLLAITVAAYFLARRIEH